MRVCLVSIVKNEEHVIQRMLNSLSKYVDEFVIVDTGSTDKTKELCRDFFKKKKIKGSVFERPWKNFGHNKTEALEIARRHSSCDYLLFMDADNYVEGDFKIPSDLDKDGYLIKQKMVGGNYFWRTQMFKRELPWRYEGVLHEAPVLDNMGELGSIEGDYVFTETHQGSRNKDPVKKYSNDVKVLKKGLEEDPDNARYMFYLGQSYMCLNDYENSAYWYLKSAQHSHWGEEVYYATFKAGECYLNLKNYRDAEKYLYKAWTIRPHRLESVNKLMEHYLNEKRYEDGYFLGKLLNKIEYNDETLFEEKDVYEWKIYDHMSLFCYYTDRYDEARYYFEQMSNVPDEEKERIEFNKKFLYVNPE